MKKIEKSIEIGGRKLTLSTGHVANQASGAVMAQYGETVVLATVVSAPLRQELDYFPLSVEYMERFYAGGRIKGSRWVKREGRPLDEEILTARLVDRSIRPLFPSDYKKDVQVVLTVLSVDFENSPDIPAAAAASAAIAVSPIPWSGPVGVTKVGLIDGKYVVNPEEGQLEKSKMELIVSSTNDAIVMIENGANEVTEEEVIGGIKEAEGENKKVIKLINELAAATGVKKEGLAKEVEDKGLVKKVKDLAGDKFKDLAGKMSTKEAGYAEYDSLKRAVTDSFSSPDEKRSAAAVFDKLFKSEVRKMILVGKRPDGRGHDELRALSSQIGILPRTHGSAIFQRGQTQALTVTTLASPALELHLESAEGFETKRYIHHYSMPPYSVGETGRFTGPGRREIGHGALAEKALTPVIPEQEVFPYTIRVVTEILSSNGSTSMASVCGSTLSLMDAGVPIASPVSVIAMGIIVEDEKSFAVLTDITGLEDGSGDMDLKVAGTKDGITALQLDVKALMLTVEMLTDALAQAKVARSKILESMLATIAKPRDEVAKNAPKIKMVTIPVEKIGELIGPGGKVIKKLMADTATQIDVDDEGKVSVSSEDKQAVEAAVSAIENMMKEAVPGEIYEGKVTRVEPYGAFVEILPGKEGLVHVSEMSEGFVEDVTKIVKVGDSVKVRVKEPDKEGKISLSMILDATKARERPSSMGGNRNGGRRDFRGPSRGFDRNRKFDTRSSGPHFPTSRLINTDSRPRS